jgi:hypothetical protein
MFELSPNRFTVSAAVIAFGLDAPSTIITATPQLPLALSTCALLDQSAAHKKKMLSSHFPWPGIGHLVKDSSGDAPPVQAT